MNVGSKDARIMGMWTDIEPVGLPRKKRHPWHFAEYMGFPSERDDRKWYIAFLFRNDDRTQFGIKEYLMDKLCCTDRLPYLARRVVLDKDFRESLLSDDPELRRWWKKH
jgi:hypothetical protein